MNKKISLFIVIVLVLIFGYLVNNLLQKQRLEKAKEVLKTQAIETIDSALSVAAFISNGTTEYQPFNCRESGDWDLYIQCTVSKEIEGTGSNDNSKDEVDFRRTMETLIEEKWKPALGTNFMGKTYKIESPDQINYLQYNSGEYTLSKNIDAGVECRLIANHRKSSQESSSGKTVPSIVSFRVYCDYISN